MTDTKLLGHVVMYSNVPTHHCS